MGDVEFGKCELCGEEKHLMRTYFYYDIKCECHSPKHFELIRHCAGCVPEEPKKTTIMIRPIKNSGIDPSIAKENDWDVVSYSYSGVIYSRNSLGEYVSKDRLHPSAMNHIFSVRRKDGEVFDVGGVYYDEFRELEPIKKFFVGDHNVMYAQFDQGRGSNDGCLGINSLSKIDPKFKIIESPKPIDEFKWTDELVEDCMFVQLEDLQPRWQIKKNIQKFKQSHNPKPQADNKPDWEWSEEEKSKYIKYVEGLNGDWIIESVKDKDGKIWNHEYWQNYEHSEPNHGFCGNSYGYFLSTKIRPNYFQIHSVKRLSDGEVFSVGDKVYIENTSKSLHREGKIVSFEIKNNKPEVKFSSPITGVYFYYLEDLHKKLPPQPQKLFTTEDGKDIFPNGKDWQLIDFVDTETWKRGGCSVNSAKMEDKRFKFFSTKEAAEKYISDNKPEGKQWMGSPSMADLKRMEDNKPDWEIVAFGLMHNDKIFYLSNYDKHTNRIWFGSHGKTSYVDKLDWDEWLAGKRIPQLFKIHSVKRLSDGEVFSIGDETNWGKIKLFTFLNAKELVACFDYGKDENKLQRYIKDLRKIESQPSPISKAVRYVSIDDVVEEAKKQISVLDYEFDKEAAWIKICFTNLDVDTIPLVDIGAAATRLLNKSDKPLFTTLDNFPVYENTDGKLYYIDEWKVVPILACNFWTKESNIGIKTEAVERLRGGFIPSRKWFRSEDEAKYYIKVNRPLGISMKEIGSCIINYVRAGEKDYEGTAVIDWRKLDEIVKSK